MQHRAIITAASTLFVLAACQDAPSALEPAAQPIAPPSAGIAAPAAVGDWIVVFRDDVRDAPGLARALAARHGGQVRATYQHAIKGFAARQLPAAAVEALRRNPQVAYVEPDAPVRLFETTQSPATWGLDRVDQLDLPLSGSYTYAVTGTGVNAYIFDTGVNLSHTEFGGRARYVPNGAGGNFVGDGRDAADCHGHGTHVAGTVGGAKYGVAKNVAIWAARVVDCRGSGNVSMVIAAVDWCTASCARPAVVNMSLGYGDVESLRTAVENSVAAGVNYAVAAGNGNFIGMPVDACRESPAGAPNAITVGATSSSDSEASFSNYGTCVDILAPGVGITSASYSSNNGTATMSGTSMATPHVAGAIALYLQGAPNATPATVAAALRSSATANTIQQHSRSASGGTPNVFLNAYALSGGTVTPPPPPPPPPTGIVLEVGVRKVKNQRFADLSWSGATGSNVDVFRNGARLTTTTNDGSHTDSGKAGSTYTYKVCEAGTSTCSNEATANF